MQLAARNAVIGVVAGTDCVASLTCAFVVVAQHVEQDDRAVVGVGIPSLVSGFRTDCSRACPPGNC
jgi:hypothetical protein